MAPFPKPETVLKRSEELLSVGQTVSALSSLSEIFASKKFRQTPIALLEPIMLRFLDLCVILRKGRTAKEGLHTYKNVAQNASVTSVETVVLRYIQRSKEELEKALKQVDEEEGPAGGKPEGTEGEQKGEGKPAHTLDVEDLEESETPEGILLGSVTEDNSRDRKYRTLVAPWLRFLWEAYRNSLDILRNNSRLEVLYQSIAQEAFSFCLTHARKTEFRRLCELLRQHVDSARKNAGQNHAIDFSDPDTLQRHLDTRFHQLNTAIELELWQQAFNTAEDFHTLIEHSKKTPKASLMAAFYEKMVRVFGVGRNYLFHAAAYSKVYSHQTPTSAVSKETEDLASAVLLSALAVPVSAGDLGKRRDHENQESRSKAARLAGLLGLPAVPTRTSLIQDALNRNILGAVSTQIRELYQILEVDFRPLSITGRIDPILKAIAENPSTARYVEPLRDVVLARLLQQLSQAYDSLKVSRIVKLATYKSDDEATKLQTRIRVEKFIIDSCRKGELDARLDHATGAIVFEDSAFDSDAAATTYGDEEEFHLLQPTLSSLLQTHLVRLAHTLHANIDVISPSNSILAQAALSRESAFVLLKADLEAERKLLRERKDIIKLRKTQAEERAARKQMEEEHLRALKLQHRLEEAERKDKQEKLTRERERIRKEQEQIKMAEVRKIAEALEKKSGLTINEKDLKDTDPSKLLAIQVDHMNKTKKDLEDKLNVVAKRIDHLERAFRREEHPLLEQDYQRQQVREKILFESARVERLESAKVAHETAIAIKKNVQKMLPDYQAFRDNLVEGYERQHAGELAESRKKIEAEKAKRKAEVIAQRAAEKKAKAEAEEREKQREREEAARREGEYPSEIRFRVTFSDSTDRSIDLMCFTEEERERAAREEAEEKERAEQEAKEAEARAEYEARQAKLRDQAEVQRRREQEIEEKAARDKLGAAAPARTPTATPGAAGWRRSTPVATPAAAATASPEAPARPPPLFGKGGTWRERAAAKERGEQTTPTSRPESPAPAPAPAVETPRSATPEVRGPPKIGGGGGWRERAAAKAAAEAAGASAPVSNGTPPNGVAEDTKVDEDGFQTVAPSKKTAYRPPQARQRESGGPSSGGGGRW